MNLTDHQREAVNFGLITKQSWKRMRTANLPEPKVSPFIRGAAVIKYEKFSNTWDYAILVDDIPPLISSVFHYNEDRSNYVSVDALTGLVTCYWASAPKQVNGLWQTELTQGMGGRKARIILDDGRHVQLNGYWISCSNEALRSVIVKAGNVGSISYAGFFLKTADFFEVARKFLPEYDICLTREDLWTRIALAEQGQPPKGFTAEQELK